LVPISFAHFSGIVHGVEWIELKWINFRKDFGQYHHKFRQKR